MDNDKLMSLITSYAEGFVTNVPKFYSGKGILDYSVFHFMWKDIKSI